MSLISEQSQKMESLKNADKISEYIIQNLVRDEMKEREKYKGYIGTFAFDSSGSFQRNIWKVEDGIHIGNMTMPSVKEWDYDGIVAYDHVNNRYYIHGEKPLSDVQFGILCEAFELDGLHKQITIEPKTITDEISSQMKDYFEDGMK